MPDSGAKAGAKGVFEDVKGKVKEVAGEVKGDQRLIDEGSAQQDKAADEREVARHEAEAEAARAKAHADETRQRSAQSRSAAPLLSRSGRNPHVASAACGSSHGDLSRRQPVAGCVPPVRCANGAPSDKEDADVQGSVGDDPALR